MLSNCSAPVHKCAWTLRGNAYGCSIEWRVVKICVNKQEEIQMWVCRREKTITRAIQLMQMMHADVFGFLVPFAVLLHRICMLGAKDRSSVFLCIAAALSNLKILPLPAKRRHLLLLVHEWAYSKTAIEPQDTSGMQRNFALHEYLSSCWLLALYRSNACASKFK